MSDLDELRASLDEDETPATSEGQNFYVSTHLDPARKLPSTARYLDDVQREQAEVDRARVEGREPDFENPGSTVGTHLIAERSLSQPLTTLQVNDVAPHAVLPDAGK